MQVSQSDETTTPSRRTISNSPGLDAGASHGDLTSLPAPSLPLPPGVLLPTPSARAAALPTLGGGPFVIDAQPSPATEPPPGTPSTLLQAPVSSQELVEAQELEGAIHSSLEDVYGASELNSALRSSVETERAASLSREIERELQAAEESFDAHGGIMERNFVPLLHETSGPATAALLSESRTAARDEQIAMASVEEHDLHKAMARSVGEPCPEGADMSETPEAALEERDVRAAMAASLTDSSRRTESGHSMHSQDLIGPRRALHRIQAGQEDVTMLSSDAECFTIVDLKDDGNRQRFHHLTLPLREVSRFEELRSLPRGALLLRAMILQAEDCMTTRVGAISYLPDQLLLFFHIDSYRSQDLLHLHSVYPASVFLDDPSLRPAVCVDARELLRQLHSSTPSKKRGKATVPDHGPGDYDPSKVPSSALFHPWHGVLAVDVAVSQVIPHARFYFTVWQFPPPCGEAVAAVTALECADDDSDVTSSYVECKHGWVLIDGVLDPTVRPRCNRPACRAKAQRWWRQHDRFLKKSGGSMATDDCELPTPAAAPNQLDGASPSIPLLIQVLVVISVGGPLHHSRFP